MTIRLAEIWPIAAPATFKLHFARWNRINQPLEAWARSRSEWQKWQEHRPARDDFNRPLIFSLMQFYHEPDTWLFGGVFRVLGRHPDRYEVELAGEGAGFIGRLKLGSSYRNRSTRVNFENHHADLTVLEILREPYSGRAFPGFDEIDLGFEELETLVRNGRPDWKAALESVKGIYLITDTMTGLRYVGSAYGDNGIWSRWCSYAATGHGGSVELRKLAAEPSLAYIRQAFRFALLEHRPVGTADEVILRREAYWKQILLTRDQFGLNRN
ncbi:GIY-YIG nuclease family protein [Sabulicella glaciei]|uniref:GIY-YIG nuclease family protein n=1 Tax=Sabulicella glaciei TaxID=2984948 RepID=A0ABT3NZT1_9PROT|nr:GIY-YIG nuclease family protein [Roseococcus sp. MDT2-1-1]MCW8087658.1 GIY-YIG nuclease family protein [Roseococcus sp. MDT2-1-1]